MTPVSMGGLHEQVTIEANSKCVLRQADLACKENAKIWFPLIHSYIMICVKVLTQIILDIVYFTNLFVQIT